MSEEGAHPYVIYRTVMDYEADIDRFSTVGQLGNEENPDAETGMTEKELAEVEERFQRFEDSILAIGITPLLKVLPQDDTLWLAGRVLAGILNQDGIVQIGDSIIKIDLIKNLGYVLTPARAIEENPELLQSLIDEHEVEGLIYKHETLEKPIIEQRIEGGGDGYGKWGIFCQDRWARSQSAYARSWSGYPGYPTSAPWQPSNSTLGMAWKIQYFAAGLYFSLSMNYQMIQTTAQGSVVSVITGYLLPIRSGYENNWRRRCGYSNTEANYGQIGYGWQNNNNSNLEYRYQGMVALNKYYFRFFARHQSQVNGAFFTATSYPIVISD